MNRSIGGTVFRITIAGALLFAAGASVAAPRLSASYAGGLWRDGYGSLWCGGNCGSGQACCSIVIH